MQGAAQESPGDALVDRVSSAVEDGLSVLGGVDPERALGDVAAPPAACPRSSTTAPAGPWWMRCFPVRYAGPG